MKDKQPKIDPRHAEVFESVFGPDMKGEGVEIPKEYRKEISKATMPLSMRYIDAFFSILITLISKVLPIIIMISVVLCDVFKNDYSLSSFKVTFNFIFHEFKVVLPLLVFSGLSWIILQIINYLCQAVVVLIKDIELRSSIKKYQKYDKAIKDRLKEKDREDTKNMTAEEKEFAEKFVSKINADTKDKTE